MINSVLFIWFLWSVFDAHYAYYLEGKISTYNKIKSIKKEPQLRLLI